MQIKTDSNGNSVMCNDRGDRAYIPYQLVIDLGMKQDRGIVGMYMNVKVCPIDSSGVIDYTEQTVDLKCQSIKIPLDYLATFTGAEVETVGVKLIRGGYNVAIDNVMNPPVEEVIL